ncbi:uncharacterized protein LOC135821763 [Sycon ciliatum]|uniref:uncharacterized protein LOC135821763 n=1 Tax=Sycon ciliatum TaxID=27933 RepID=UPI0031F67F39
MTFKTNCLGRDKAVYTWTALASLPCYPHLDEGSCQNKTNYTNARQMCRRRGYDLVDFHAFAILKLGVRYCMEALLNEMIASSYSSPITIWTSFKRKDQYTIYKQGKNDLREELHDRHGTSHHDVICEAKWVHINDSVYAAATPALTTNITEQFAEEACRQYGLHLITEDWLQTHHSVLFREPWLKKLAILHKPRNAPFHVKPIRVNGRSLYRTVTFRQPNSLMYQNTTSTMRARILCVKFCENGVLAPNLMTCMCNRTTSYGEYCEKECKCLNQGQCDDKGKCICPKRFTGSHCQEVVTCATPLAPTFGSFSLPAGVSSFVYNTVGTFVCNPGHRLVGDATTQCLAHGDVSSTPPICQNVNECNNPTLHTCDQNALCSDVIGTFTCKCLVGYIGDGKRGNCQNIDECLPASPCHVDASCIDNDGGYMCLCKSGYHGNGIQCQACNCLNHGQCTEDGTCNCRKGFHGDKCQHIVCTNPWVKKNKACECKPRPDGPICTEVCNCLNDGQCTEDGTCNCRKGFHGDQCQHAFKTKCLGTDKAMYTWMALASLPCYPQLDYGSCQKKTNFVHAREMCVRRGYNVVDYNSFTKLGLKLGVSDCIKSLLSEMMARRNSSYSTPLKIWTSEMYFGQHLIYKQGKDNSSDALFDGDGRGNHDVICEAKWLQANGSVHAAATPAHRPSVTEQFAEDACQEYGHHLITKEWLEEHGHVLTERWLEKLALLHKHQQAPYHVASIRVNGHSLYRTVMFSARKQTFQNATSKTQAQILCVKTCETGVLGPDLSCVCNRTSTYGQYCEKACKCLNQGQCDNKGECSCPKGFTGDKCQLVVCTHPWVKKNKVCECTARLDGPNCTEACKCLNDGQCTKDGTCICRKRFHGDQCQHTFKTKCLGTDKAMYTWIALAGLPCHPHLDGDSCQKKTNLTHARQMCKRRGYDVVDYNAFTSQMLGVRDCMEELLNKMMASNFNNPITIWTSFLRDGKHVIYKEGKNNLREELHDSSGASHLDFEMMASGDSNPISLSSGQEQVKNKLREELHDSSGASHLDVKMMASGDSNSISISASLEEDDQNIMYQQGKNELREELLDSNGASHHDVICEAKWLHANSSVYTTATPALRPNVTEQFAEEACEQYGLHLITGAWLQAHGYVLRESFLDRLAIRQAPYHVKPIVVNGNSLYRTVTFSEGKQRFVNTTSNHRAQILCVMCKCLNQGQCDDKGKCICPKGFTGDNCQKVVCTHPWVKKNKVCECKPRLDAPKCTVACNCLNNGQCTEDGTCVCPTGFHGDQCQDNFRTKCLGTDKVMYTWTALAGLPCYSGSCPKITSWTKARDACSDRGYQLVDFKTFTLLGSKLGVRGCVESLLHEMMVNSNSSPITIWTSSEYNRRRIIYKQDKNKSSGAIFSVHGFGRHNVICEAQWLHANDSVYAAATPALGPSVTEQCAEDACQQYGLRLITKDWLQEHGHVLRERWLERLALDKSDGLGYHVAPILVNGQSLYRTVKFSRQHVTFKNETSHEDAKILCVKSCGSGVLAPNMSCACNRTMSYGEECEKACKCLNQGECDDKGECSCPRGFTGHHCQLVVCEEPWVKKSKVCECQPGLDGPNCTEACNCLNDGQCTDDGSCNCRNGFHGDKSSPPRAKPATQQPPCHGNSSSATHLPALHQERRLATPLIRGPAPAETGDGPPK